MRWDLNRFDVMSDTREENKTELFDGEDQEKYLLYSKTAIINVLHELSKKPDIITAYFNQGREYILTAVLTVMNDRNLVVLDYGADEAKNRRLLDYGRAVCVTKHDNISIKFAVDGLQRAKFQDRQSFAAILPETLYRQQRREFFRVTTPVLNPLKCYIPRPGGQTLELNIMDISCGGLGLADPGQLFDPEINDILTGCHIELPEMGTLHCDLQVRNSFMQPQNSGQQLHRIGCSFVSLSQDKNALIQRYIHRVQLEQKALAKH